MKSRRIKRGSIIRNHWASDDNPTRFFIYLGVKGEYVIGLDLSNNTLSETQYYKSSIRDVDKYEVVGYCPIFDIAKKSLLEFLDEDN